MFSSIADIVGHRLSPTQLAWMYRKISPALARTLAMQRFRATVRWAGEHSAFYRAKFAEMKIDPSRVRTPADLGELLTTPDDISVNPEQFICRPPSIVFESSGTSGTNKQVFFDEQELQEIGVTMAGGFSLMGIGPEDRVANAFDFSIWIPGLLCHYGLSASRAFCQAFGKVDPIEVYRRLRNGRFTVVMGEPTWLIRLTQLAEADGNTYPLKMLMGGAEEMPADAIPWMKKVWGGAVVKMNYASVEMGPGIGFQPCDNHDGYHLDHFDFLPEIIEADADGYGELIFTTLRRRVMPLLRYRTRDLTRIEKEPCRCGLSAPRLARLRGRRDELVVASGGNLYPKMFEQIIRAVDGVTHDWQVVFTLEGVREILTIDLESNRADHHAIEQEIHASATDRFPDLMKNLALGIFEMRVIVHPRETLRKSRKLRRLVDRRHFAESNPLADIEAPSEAAGTLA